MEIIYSKQNPKVALHLIYRANEFYNIEEGHRKDIVDAKEFIQVSALKMKKGQKFKPHQHIWKDGEEKVIAQESWVVIRGSVKCSFYDTDGTILSEVFQELDEGWNEFILNIELPAGEGYGLRAGNNEPYLWRDSPNANLNYPYEIGSLASIVSTTVTSQNTYNYYYYFYNWRMHSADPCISERVEFNVVLDPSSHLEVENQEIRRTLVKIIDQLGREVNEVLGQIVFYIYDDGTAEKMFVVE